ncbi:unnamed protein product [Chrysodeixis includens]|uniref:Uncharacterized protein n=1 Tax=Chrysodeixis includens TaxID=689277 RepID=A0A9N8KV05_CHRIL|nr:unnamed protein product [Chrysodeixis includens]
MRTNQPRRLVGNAACDEDEGTGIYVAVALLSTVHCRVAWQGARQARPIDLDNPIGHGARGGGGGPGDGTLCLPPEATTKKECIEQQSALSVQLECTLCACCASQQPRGRGARRDATPATPDTPESAGRRRPRKRASPQSASDALTTHAQHTTTDASVRDHIWGAQCFCRLYLCLP